MANTCPAVRSRNVTLQPETKLAPLIVNGCALAEPVTGLGLTLLIDGGEAGATTLNWYWPGGLAVRIDHLHAPQMRRRGEVGVDRNAGAAERADGAIGEHLPGGQVPQRHVAPGYEVGSVDRERLRAGWPVTGLGLTLLIDGGEAGATTLNWYWPVVWPSGLITSTLHRCAAVVKLGLIVMLVLLNELMARLANTCPAVRSRNVTLHPDTKLAPLIVNGCAG